MASPFVRGSHRRSHSFETVNVHLSRTPASNVLPSSQSSDSMMMTRNIRPQAPPVVRPQIPDTMSPTSSWNEGCY